MSLLTTLPVLAGECIESYVIRLALANDYDTVTRFFKETSKTNKLSINSNQFSLVEFVKSVDVNLRCQSFLPATQEIKGAVGIECMLHSKPHACPHCVDENHFFEVKWQLLQVTHCDVHQCELSSHCHCGELFEWNETLLEYGCAHCYSPWSEIAEKASIHTLPAYVTHFSDLPFDERESFLEDMMTVAIRALRPFDSVHHKIRQLHHCQVNWTDLMTQSFKMLTDTPTIRQWTQNLAFRRSHYKSLGELAVFYPIITLQERLHSDWLIKGYKPKLSAVNPSNKLLNSGVLTSCNTRNSSALLETTKEKIEAQLVNHVDQVAFVKMTGCDLNTARTIFKMKSMNSLSKVGQGRYAFIDINSFVHKLKSMNSLPLSNTVKITKCEGLLTTFGLSTEEACIEVLNASLPVALNPNAPDFISSLQVNELQFSTYMETEYIKRNNFSLSHTAHLLVIPRDKVKCFGRINLLKELPAPKGQYLYSGTSISQFLTQYECLERWTNIHEICLEKVLKEVTLQGFKPAIAPFIFEKNIAFSKLLNGFHNHQWYQPEQLALAI